MPSTEATFAFLLNLLLVLSLESNGTDGRFLGKNVMLSFAGSARVCIISICLFKGDIYESFQRASDSFSKAEIKECKLEEANGSKTAQRLSVGSQKMGAELCMLSLNTNS